MKSLLKSRTLSTGLAMFAMFFGAGNAIFPLIVGYHAQDKTLFGIFGLLLTSVIVPFAGLIGMILFDGNYKQFFDRMGKFPGYLVAILIMGLIGPFGATPRCVAVSYSTLKMSFPDMSAALFSLIACAVIFAFTYKKNRIVDLIGVVLTPVLIAFLGFIIVKGLLFAESSVPSTHQAWEVFFQGFKEGYNTMDLLAAFFFAPIVLSSFTRGEGDEGAKTLFRSAMNASYIGAFLLAITYVGFSLIAAYHGQDLQVNGSEELIGAIAQRIIGPEAGFVAAAIVALACLTTAIALTTVFAEFLQNIISQGKISYEMSVAISLIITYCFSIMQFSGISAFLAPMMQICYPALIVLTFFNIMSKLGYFQAVKAPVFITFGGSLAAYLLF